MTATAERKPATLAMMYDRPQCPVCREAEGTEPGLFALPATGADDPHALVIMFFSCEPCDTKSRRADDAELKTITQRLSRYFDGWLIDEQVPRLIAQSNGKVAAA
jgi:hypothetical protein